MSLFKKDPIYCDICGQETGVPGNKKHRAQDGVICNTCFTKAGYQQGMVCFADPIAVLKDRVHAIDIAEFSADTYSFDVKIDGLEIDPIARKWRIRMLKFKPMSYTLEKTSEVTPVHNFDDVTECNFIIDKKTVASIKNHGIGRAVVGGIIFGGAGAVVGAITAKDKIKETVISNGSGIGIVLKDNSSIYIPIFTGNPVSAGSAQRSRSYGGTSETVDEMLQEFEKMINKSPTDVKTEASNHPDQAGSSADELRKYKSLLDDGIINQDEFDVKKKQLLSM